MCTDSHTVIQGGQERSIRDQTIREGPEIGSLQLLLELTNACTHTHHINDSLWLCHAVDTVSAKTSAMFLKLWHDILSSSLLMFVAQIIHRIFHKPRLRLPFSQSSLTS